MATPPPIPASPRTATQRPVGPELPGWTPRPLPPREGLSGRLVRLEPLSAGRHAASLYAHLTGHPELWDYMAAGPFADAASFAAWVDGIAPGADPMFLAICDAAGGDALGMASWMRIAPRDGAIEVGNIMLSPALQRSAAATEAMHLMMARAFDLGYRRYEWKCNALNLPSRRAAQRLGLSFEGVFRNHMVIKNRSRDTAWFAITDADWPAIDAAHRRWLDPGNFDAQGSQRLRLADLTAPHLVARDPVV